MDTATNIGVIIKDLLDKKLNNEQIKAELQTLGYEERHIHDLLQEINKLRNAKKASAGLILILIGAVICLLSCVLTLTGSYSQAVFTTVLYGFTTAGIVIVFLGLVKIFN